MDDPRRFRIAPATWSTALAFLEVYPAGRVVVPAIVFLLGFGAAGLFIPAMRMPWGLGLLLVAGGLLAPILGLAAACWSRSSRLEIGDDRVSVRGGPLGPMADRGALRLEEAEAVDLLRDPTFLPASGSGLNLPGYCAGAGAVRRGSRAAWLLTDLARVVHIPARAGGPALLISVDDPAAVVAALRALGNVG